MTRMAQMLFGLCALLALTLALFIPFPPPRSWEQSAFIRLTLLSVAALIVAIALSATPRFGRALGLVVGLLAGIQAGVIMYAFVRSSSPSFPAAALALAPWLFAISGTVVLARRSSASIAKPMSNEQL